MRLRTVTMVAAACAGVLAAASVARAAGSSPLMTWLEAFGEAVDRVEKNAIKPFDPAEVIGGAISGLLASVDDQSVYIEPELFDARMETGEATPGFSLSIESGLPMVSAVQSDGAAYSAGMRVGDYVTVIDDVGVIGLPQRDVQAQLKGDAGKTVTLALMKPDGERRILNLVLAQPSRAVQVVRFERGYGYIRPTGLTESAVSDLSGAIRRLLKENPGMKGLILDLRNNPGGLLDQTVGMSDVFLTEGIVLVARGREKSDVERYGTRGADELGGRPLVVLVDASTAAGAEAIAAGLQDRGRATIVGMPTFGADALQQVIPLNGGRNGAIKLTTARLHRPDGRALAEGVTPDLLVARDADEASRPRRAKVKAPIGKPALPPAGFEGDYQLDRAIASLDGRS